MERSLHSEAIDQGVTLIDTADVYGFGHSEELIARIIKDRSKGSVIIATKAGNNFCRRKEFETLELRIIGYTAIA